MHVETGFERIADIGTAIECLRAERHQRMQAEHRCHLPVVGVSTLADVAFVFRDTFTFLVTVRHFVTKTAAQAYVFKCPFDLIETAVPTGR